EVVARIRPPGSDEVDLRVVADEATRRDLRRLEALPMGVTKEGVASIVRLSQVAQLQEGAGLTALQRLNRQPVVTVGANLTPGTTLSEVTGPLAAHLTEVNQGLPAGYSARLGGESEEQEKSFGSLLS